MKTFKIYLLSLTLIFVDFYRCNAAKKFVVSKSVIDLRSAPKSADPALQTPTVFKDNPLQLSQVLFGKPLCALGDDHDDDEESPWLRVKLLEQKVFAAHLGRLHELEGFLRVDQIVEVEDFLPCNLVVTEPWSALYTEPDVAGRALLTISSGTKLTGAKQGEDWVRVLLPSEVSGFREAYLRAEHVRFVSSTVRDSTEEIRSTLVSMSKKFLGNPYCWGGRSFTNETLKEQLTGCDCAEFTNLVSRMIGLQIPKNTTSQLHGSAHIDGKDMQAGDLIFFAQPEQGERTYHVMMYLGDGDMIEATGTVGTTRVISDLEKLGAPIESFKYGDDNGDRIIYFGTYLETSEKLQAARDVFLGQMSS